jgi:hypothetical protein
MNIPFHAFGPAHLAVIGAVPALAAVLAWLQRRLPARSFRTFMRESEAAWLGSELASILDPQNRETSGTLI